MKVKYLVPLLTACYLSIAAVLKATSLGTWMKTSLVSFFNEKTPGALGSILSNTTAAIAHFTNGAATAFFGRFLDICKISDTQCITYQSLPGWLQYLYIYGMVVTLILIPVAIIYMLLVEFEITKQSIVARQLTLTTSKMAELKRGLVLTVLSLLLPYAWGSAVISVIFCINQFGSGV